MNINRKIMENKEKLVKDIASGKMDYVCFGAGKCFFDFIKRCCVNSKFPLPRFVCDNNSALWGRKIKVGTQTVDIVSPNCLRSIEIDKTIIAMSTTLPMGILDDLTYKYRCIYYNIILLKSIEAYYFVRDNKERLDEVCDAFEDEASKEAYEEFFNRLLAGNFFNQDIYTGNPYWNNDVIPKLSDKEIIVHAGVFDGEDINRALKANKAVEIHGFEPNGEMFQRAVEKYRGNANVHLYPFALGAEESEIFFNANGSSSAMLEDEAQKDMLSQSEMMRVKTKSIDNLFSGKNISLLTLDVEGMEVQVIEGAKEVIKSRKPKIAVCVYHELEHYVVLAEQIKRLNPEYKLYFRQHSTLAIESVLYAI